MVDLVNAHKASQKQQPHQTTIIVDGCTVSSSDERLLVDGGGRGLDAGALGCGSHAAAAATVPTRRMAQRETKTKVKAMRGNTEAGQGKGKEVT